LSQGDSRAHSIPFIASAISLFKGIHDTPQPDVPKVIHEFVQSAFCTKAKVIREVFCWGRGCDNFRWKALTLNNAILEIGFHAGLLKAFCAADQLEGSIDISASPDLEDKRRIIEVARGYGC
jgi:hypothetical protein